MSVRGTLFWEKLKGKGSQEQYANEISSLSVRKSIFEGGGVRVEGESDNTPNSSPELGVKTTNDNKNTFQKMVIRMHVNKFRRKVKEFRFDQRKLTTSHYIAMGDKSFDLHSAQPDESIRSGYSRRQQKGLQMLQKLQRKVFIKTNQRLPQQSSWIQLYKIVDRINLLLPVFHPEKDNNVLWQILTFFCTAFLLIMIPIDLSYNKLLLSHDIFFLTMISSSVLLINLIQELNTGFMENGLFVSERAKVIKLRLRSGCWIDFISILLVFVIPIDQRQASYTKNGYERRPSDILLILFVSQIRHILTFKRNFDERMNWHITKRTIYEICMILVTLLYVQHCFGCVWSFIGLREIEVGYQGGWIENYKLENSQWQDIHLCSLYYTLVTFSSVGYGDLTPQTKYERVFALFFVLASSLQLSYTLTRVGNLLEELNHIDNLNIKKMRIINQFMDRQHISIKLKYQIRDYLRLYWASKNHFDEQDYKVIINDLSEILNEKLMSETTQTLVSNIRFFDETFSRWIKLELSQIIEQINQNPECIVPLAEDGDQFLYYLDHGIIEEVLCMSQKSEFVSTNTILKDGSHFGLDTFISGSRDDVSYKTKGFCKLFRVSRAKFIKILKEYPEDYQKFCMKKDQLNLKLIESLEQRRCQFCRQISCLSLATCQSVHLVIDREKIIKKQGFINQYQERLKFRRRKRRTSQNALLQQIDLEDKSQEYLKNIQNPYEGIYDEEEEAIEKQSPNLPEVPQKQSIKKGLKSAVEGIRSKRQTVLAIGMIELKKRQPEVLVWQKRVQQLLEIHSQLIHLNFSEREFEKLKFLNIQLTQKVKQFDLKQLEFDHIRSYVSYMPQNNLEVVLHDQGKEPKISKQLIRFMFYPKLYIEQFQKKIKGSQKNDSNMTKLEVCPQIKSQ